MIAAMKNTPPGWPRISSSLYYADARKAIAWLAEAFGFELRLLVDGEDGSVRHSELTYGEGVIMVSDGASHEAMGRTPPSKVGGANTQNLMVYVDDVDAHHARAIAAGATITEPLSVHDYGEAYWTDRSYGVKDLGGHAWWFTQRIRDPKPAAK